MARIRTIKPEFWQDEDLASVSETARLLAIGLLNIADDEGWFKANEMLVKAAIFPLCDTSSSIHTCLTELSRIGYISMYECSRGRKYGRVRNFNDHQRINRPTPSRINGIDGLTECSVSGDGVLTPGKERKGRERKGKERNIRQKKTELDFSSWPSRPNDKLLEDWLKKKKSAGGSVSQSAINTVGREVSIAVKNGFTVDECISAAENAGWRGFKHEWMGTPAGRDADYGSEVADL